MAKTMVSWQAFPSLPPSSRAPRVSLAPLSLPFQTPATQAISSVKYDHLFPQFCCCNRCPFGLLVKFKLWNLTSFKFSIVFQRLSGKLPMFVFVFAKNLTRVRLAIVLVPGQSGNTKPAYSTRTHRKTNYDNFGVKTFIVSFMSNCRWRC